MGFKSQELSGKTETFTVWILTILSLLKSPGRKKKVREEVGRKMKSQQRTWGNQCRENPEARSHGSQESK